MEAEVQEIREHLRRFPPFDRLDAEWLDRIASNVEVAYYREGASIHEYGEPVDMLRYIRSGAVEVYRHNGELYNRLSEGDIFGQAGLLHKRRVRFPAKAIEDTLLYLIPGEIFDQLANEDDHFADFVELSGPRLKTTVEQNERENDLMVTRVRRLLSRMPVMVEEGSSVQTAAREMTENHVSSILLLAEATPDDERSFTGEDDRHWRLTGILTDQDLRIRVLAAGGSADTPLVDIKHERLITIRSDESVSLLSVPALDGTIPVIASVALDKGGGKLNVNADSAAGMVAAAVVGEKLVMVSDTHGIRRDINDPESWISSLNETQIKEMIDAGIITDAMFPKVEACLTALDAGVRKAHIIDGRIAHSLLLEIYTEEGIGTEIVKGKS